MKERLNKSANFLWIAFFRKNDILHSILFGPEVLLALREDMILGVSSLSVGCRSIVLLLSFQRESEKFLCENVMFFLYFQL